MGQQGEEISVCRRNQVLGSLPEGDVQRILKHGECVTLRSGQTFYREGGQVSALYFPAGCVVSIIVFAGGRDEVEVAIIGDEGVVGIPAAIGVPEGVGKAIVQVPGDALHLRLKIFQELQHDSAAFAASANRYLYAFLKQLAQNGACHQFHTVEQRCAKWLLMTNDRTEAEAFNVTQRLLAEILGTRRANVNAALNNLRGAGAIDYRYGKISVADRALLTGFACSCYSRINKSLALTRS